MSEWERASERVGASEWERASITLPLAHSHASTRSLARFHSLTRTLPLAHSHGPTRSLARSHSLTRTLSLAHWHTPTRSLARSHSLTRTPYPYGFNITSFYKAFDLANVSSSSQILNLKIPTLSPKQSDTSL